MSNQKEEPILPTYHDLLVNAKLNGGLQMYLAEIPERYREILLLYERAYPSGTPGFYPVFQIEACLKMAGFLLAVYSMGF